MKAIKNIYIYKARVYILWRWIVFKNNIYISYLPLWCRYFWEITNIVTLIKNSGAIFFLSFCKVAATYSVSVVVLALSARLKMSSLFTLIKCWCFPSSLSAVNSIDIKISEHYTGCESDFAQIFTFGPNRPGHYILMSFM